MPKRTTIMPKILISVTGENTCRSDVKDAVRCAKRVEQALGILGYKTDYLWLHESDFQDEKRIIKAVSESGCYCVFNLFEGFSYDAAKEIEFAEILEKAGIPFTGNPSSALRTCLNKHKLKLSLISRKVDIPGSLFIQKPSDLELNGFSFPLFIKPCCEDASVGINADSLVTSHEKLKASVLAKLEQFPKGLVVEEFIQGMEVNVGFLGKFPYRVLGISFIDYVRYPEFHPFLSYAAKWDESSREYREIIPQFFENGRPESIRKITDIARNAGHAAGCQGYFRVDMREKNGKYYILDVNPNPDINQDSGFIRQAFSAGLSYEEVIQDLISSVILSE
jgi:D-alanine-D-alanine ligase